MKETKDQLITWGITEDSENNGSCILGLQAMPARNNNPLAKADTREAANEEGLLYLHFFRNPVLYERPSCIKFVLPHFTNFIPYNSNKLNNQMQQFSSLLLDVLCRPTCFGCLHAQHQELTAALTASGFNLERGGSRVVGRGLAAATTNASR